MLEKEEIYNFATVVIGTTLGFYLAEAFFHYGLKTKTRFSIDADLEKLDRRVSILESKLIATIE